MNKYRISLQSKFCDPELVNESGVQSAHIEAHDLVIMQSGHAVFRNRKNDAERFGLDDDLYKTIKVLAPEVFIEITICED